MFKQSFIIILLGSVTGGTYRAYDILLEGTFVNSDGADQSWS